MRGRLFAILILFVISIVGTFAFTIVTLKAQVRDMSLISLAGRQRMLNQQHMNEVLLASQGFHADFLTPRTTFNRTLDAFMTGGQVTDFPEMQEMVTVPDFSEREIIEVLVATKAAMDELSSKADQVLQLSKSDAAYIAKLNEFYVLNNRVHVLADQTVNRLTQYLETRLSNLIRWEIITGIFVLLLGFFLTRQVLIANQNRDREMEEREKAEKYLSLQYAITRILSESRDIHTGLSRILETLTHNYHWAFAAYWEVDAEAQVIRCREVGPSKGHGLAAFAETTMALTLTKGKGLPGHVWQIGSPASIWNVEKDPNFPRAPVAVEAGLYGALGFPVQNESGVIGVIEIFSRNYEPLDPDFLYMLSLLGQQIGQFILRQQDHAKIGKSEALLREILKFAEDGVISVDQGQRIQLFNRSAEHLLGYRAEEVVGQPLELLLPLTPIDPSSPALGDYSSISDLDQKRGSIIQVRGSRKDGTAFVAEATLSTICLHDHRVTTIILRDITQRYAREATIQKSYQFTEEILTSISAILISVDTCGMIRQWSSTAESTLGLMASTVLGREFTSCAVPWDWSVVNPGVQRCMDTQEAVTIETLRYSTPSGMEGFLELSINPIRGKHNGDPSGFLLLGWEISGKKQLEMQLVLAQKMESIGQLAAGIAHEINTPIQFVTDNLVFLRESFASIQRVLEAYDQVMQTLPPDSHNSHRLQTVNSTLEKADLEYAMTEIPKALSQSLDGAKRVTNIVTAMKDFSHPGSREKSITDLNKIIDSTIVVARNEWKYVSEVVTDFDPKLPLVPCLRGEFSQVILNLLVNAAHAIADVVRSTNGQKGTIMVSTKAKEGWAEIRIADTGTGIPVRSRDKIFDPFYTTKEVGRGTGQGLAIAHNVIVDKHGGRLTFETTPGVGTIFLIRLPLTDPCVAEGIT